MLFYCNIEKNKYCFDSSKSLDISIEQKFNDDQPNFYHTDAAVKSIYTDGSFIGSTEHNGSCNVHVININVHCNGTHTETKQHIDHSSKSISNVLSDYFFLAKLITVTPINFTDNIKETYQPSLDNNNLIISSENIQAQLCDFDSHYLDALVIRTEPNTKEKKNKKYDDSNSAYPFMTNTAIRLINTTNIKHLLIDTPSLERSYNSATMSNHKLFSVIHFLLHQ